jgi:hypothetical protein
MGWTGPVAWPQTEPISPTQPASGPVEEQIAWVQQVRDLGPLIWLVALAAVAAWFLIYGAAAARARPRKVPAGPEVLDPPADEPVALVNLLTSNWNLGHEAIPATVLDLSARGFLSIHQGGDGSVSVHVPATSRADDTQLRVYEHQVLDHLRQMAAATPDRVVPGAALTTGPDDQAKAWWKRFRKAVHQDAKGRGLARRRWSRGAYLTLFVVGVIGAVPFGVALASLVYADQGTDGDLVYGAVVYSLLAMGAPGVVIAVLAGKRQVADTEAGRAVAARWLGLRSALGRDPRFTEVDASGAAVWGRKLAYGAALGISHGAVASLPLGAENKREIWSTASGMWRVVRVRYHLPGSFGGNHPALGIFTGLLFTTALVMPYMFLQAEFLEPTEMLLLLPLSPMLVMGAFGLFLVVKSLGDLVGGRRIVEGEVLRVRETGTSRWTSSTPGGPARRSMALVWFSASRS